MTTTNEPQKWAAMHAAEIKADAMWADPNASAQAKQAACWEAECARQQWSDAADRMFRKAARLTLKSPPPREGER